MDADELLDYLMEHAKDFAEYALSRGGPDEEVPFVVFTSTGEAGPDGKTVVHVASDEMGIMSGMMPMLSMENGRLAFCKMAGRAMGMAGHGPLQCVVVAIESTAFKLDDEGNLGSDASAADVITIVGKTADGDVAITMLKTTVGTDHRTVEEVIGHAAGQDVKIPIKDADVLCDAVLNENHAALKEREQAGQTGVDTPMGVGGGRKKDRGNVDMETMVRQVASPGTYELRFAYGTGH